MISLGYMHLDTMIGNVNNKVTMSINAMTTLASITNSYSVTLYLGPRH